jgi:ribosomal protein S18 acetylase RimI-like enzyme
MSPRDAALVEALYDEPFYQRLLVDTPPGAHRRVLADYFAYSLAEAERTGRVVAAPDPSHGAAAWLLPRTPAVDAVEQRAKREAFARLFGPQGCEHYARMIAFMGPRGAAAVPPDAWYLSILGVHPAAQGRGLGAALNAPTMAEPRRAGAVTWLETFSPRAERFYARLGFVTCATHREPTTGEDYAIMRCEA